jgi:transcriptional regulator with XRE-family HTH domain
MRMTIDVKNPIAELRKSRGYTLEQLSVISGLTELEITKLEKGELVDTAKLARLMSACGARPA